MNFDMQMTISDLVQEMNNGGNQDKLYKASKINKDVIPYLFRVGGYVREKNKYVPTTEANESATIESLLPMAKQAWQQAKSEKVQGEQVHQESKQAAKRKQVEKVSFESKDELKNLILDALGLTMTDIETIKTLKDSEPKGTIYEAIGRLSERKRGNKTYYISEEIAHQVQAFTDNHTIKISQFVEVALLEAMKKYGKN